jgi:hypothetical protein
MAWTPVELLSLSITGLDKRIGGLSDRAFDSAVISEEPAGKQAPADDATQRSLLEAVDAGAESSSDPAALAQATESRLIEQTDDHKRLTPLGEYVLATSSSRS